jgi:hypothetical protein
MTSRAILHWSQPASPVARSLAVSDRLMRIVAFLCVLFAVLHSQAAEFPKEGWWAIPGFANAAGGATYNLLRLQRYTPAAATIPGLEPPKPIQDHPEQAWVLTFFRVEMATADADNLKLQRDSCLARITADSISCFSLAENLYRYSVVDDAVIWEFVRSDLESSFGFSHLFPPLENKKLTFKPTSPDALQLLKHHPVLLHCHPLRRPTRGLACFPATSLPTCNRRRLTLLEQTRLAARRSVPCQNQNSQTTSDASVG